MNHTPKPWEYYREEMTDGIGFTIIYDTVRDALGKNICRLRDTEPARLIAAAPEMLEALIKTTRWLEENFEPTSQFLRNLHVIEKATGKTWEEIKESTNGM